MVSTFRGSSVECVAAGIPCGYVVYFHSPNLHKPCFHRCRTSRTVAVLSPRAPRTFVRLIPERDGTIHLQTAVTTYEMGLNQKVLTLFSLLHIAEPSYYELVESSIEGNVVLFELMAPETATDGNSKLKTLRIPVFPPSALEKAARSLNATAQLSAMNLRQTNWYVADLPVDHISVPGRNGFMLQIPRLVLNVVAACLPCPELNAALIHAFSARTLVTPFRLLQLLNADLVTRRRLTYAWRAVASTSIKANARVLDNLRRNRVAWEALNEVRDANVALLYGAWHSGWFCRRAEADGMKFVRQSWITAMVLPSVPIRRFDVIRWALFTALYCTYAGLDWIWCIERLAQSFTGGFHVDVSMLLLYLTRHVAPYWAFRRWFDEWDTASRTDDM